MFEALTVLLSKVLESEGFLEMSMDDVSEVLQALPSSVLGHRDTVRAIRNWVQFKPDLRQHYAAQVCRATARLTYSKSHFVL